MRTVAWKIHLKSSPEKVFHYLTTPEGRESFWAEKAPEKNGMIHFDFPNGEKYTSNILYVEKNREFHLDYFNSTVKFVITPKGHEGADLKVINEGIPDEEYLEVYAGWVSVLLTLKAAVDYDVDLRNHNNSRTWDQGFVDN